MTNNLKIEFNGQRFEVPMDLSLFTGMLGSMGMIQPPTQLVGRGPEVLQTAPERLIQSSHERMEETFFNQFRIDLDEYKRSGLLGKDERILTALIALHKRVKRLEVEKSVPRRVNLRMGMVRNSIPGLEIPTAEPTETIEEKPIEKPMRPTKPVKQVKQVKPKKTSKKVPKKPVKKK